MAANPDVPLPAPTPGSTEPAATSSALDELRAAFAKRVENPRLLKRLPAPTGTPFAGKLVAEYRVLDTKETKEVFQAEDDRDNNIDALIQALVAIRVHDPKHPNADDRGTVDLTEWAGVDLGGPLRFDKRLLSALGLHLEEPTARNIVMRMFEGNELAMGAQAAQVMAWMTDTTEETLQDFAPGS